ncbi:MAG: hypothetical protein IKN57_04565, partial [Parasporobacterium sp.]|nr:hypothetical protein [Parasporobacterium sp.]
MKIDFNSGWQFCVEGGEWQDVTLPHDAMLTRERTADAEAAGASGYFPGGRYGYKKTFSLTAEEAGKHISFIFEGVYKNAV